MPSQVVCLMETLYLADLESVLLFKKEMEHNRIGQNVLRHVFTAYILKF